VCLRKSCENPYCNDPDKYAPVRKEHVKTDLVSPSSMEKKSLYARRLLMRRIRGESKLKETAYIPNSRRRINSSDDQNSGAGDTYKGRGVSPVRAESLLETSERRPSTRCELWGHRVVSRGQGIQRSKWFKPPDGRSNNNNERRNCRGDTLR